MFPNATLSNEHFRSDSANRSGLIYACDDDLNATTDLEFKTLTPKGDLRLNVCQNASEVVFITYHKSKENRELN